MNKPVMNQVRSIILSIIQKLRKVLRPFKKNYRRLKNFFWGIYLRQFFQTAHLITLLPLGYHTQNRIAYKLGRAYNPFRQLRPNLLSSFQTALGVSLTEARQILHQWEASKGLATMEIFRYAQMDREWVERHVEIDEPEILSEIAQKGGQILIYHTFHEHTLCAILGQSGIKLTPISAQVKNQPFAHHIGRYLNLSLSASEKKLSGGNYIYTGDKCNINKAMNTAFANGEVILAACDTHHIDSSFHPIDFLGSSIRIKIGVLKWTKEAGVPVYFALLYPNFMGGYRLHLKSIGPLTDLQRDAQAYFNFFEKHLREAPWAWQGWWWYPTMIDPQFSLSFLYEDF
ncbi:MAG: hypothetical protein HQK65_05915 [Desulfamplus sp.]|nr:hypothetical protein [Desulfamplus sp.]